MSSKTRVFQNGFPVRDKGTYLTWRMYAEVFNYYRETIKTESVERLEVTRKFSGDPLTFVRATHLLARRHWAQARPFWLQRYDVVQLDGRRWEVRNIFYDEHARETCVSLWHLGKTVRETTRSVREVREAILENDGSSAE